jgi:hypothetical protein
MLPEGRNPREGDIVGAQGQSGPLIVVSVDEKVRTVNARAWDERKTGPTGPVVKGIPWSTLTLLQA